MRRLLSAALSLALAVLLCTQSLAAGSAEIVRAFVYDGTLYTYVSMEGLEKPITKAEARVVGQTFPAAGRLETVRQAGAPVTWLVLVDNSNSMPAFRQEVDAFAEALVQSGGENTHFILSTFGNKFDLVEENVPPEELAAKMAAIPFDERVTRLHTAIGQALDYFEGLPRERNELRCMVILSDAVQYDPTGGVPYEELLERVSRSDVMLYSVGLGDDQDSLDSLGHLAEASGGLHQVVDAQTAGDAAGTLAEHSGALYVTGFDLTGCVSQGGPEEFSVTFASGGELICRVQGQVELPELTGEPVTPAPPSVQDPPKEPEPAGKTPEPSTPSAPDSKPADSDGQERPILAIVIGAGAAVLVLIAVLILLLRRKKSAPAAAPVQPVPPVVTGTQAESAGIYMRLEVLRGELAGGQKQLELELRDELTVGSAPACDVPLADDAVSAQQARVYLADGAVYLEDRAGGMKVNGEALQASRRLRSGDEIAVGDTRFRFKF